jgi:putative ABC transport system substrate-binding protein
MGRVQQKFLLVASVSLVVPFFALAQPMVYRIAVLERESAQLASVNLEALRQGFRELGYVEGKNLAIEYRSTDGHNEAYPALCREVVGLKVDLIVVRGTPPALACKKATTSIPIIFVGAGDPVSDGIITSFAHPGGNVTGFSSANNQLAAKRLELLRELFPRAVNIAVLLNLGNPSLAGQRKEVEAAAPHLGMKVEIFDVRTREDLQSSIDQASKQRFDALYVAIDAVTEANREMIADLALKHRLPTINAEATFVEAGGLISYAISNPANYRRVAGLADKIFKGAKPGDLPVEQPSTLMLEINLKTANALGVTIPKQVLFRADRVIE